MVGEKNANHINSMIIMHLVVKHKCNKAFRAVRGQAHDDRVTAVHNLFWGNGIEVPEKEDRTHLSSRPGDPAAPFARL